MPLRTPKAIPTTSVADIWSYATRTITDLTATRLGYIDSLATPADFMADITALLTQAYFDTILTVARLGFIDSLATPADFMADVSALLEEAHFDLSEFEIAQVPVAENDAVTIAITTADQSLGSKDIVVDVPAGATIISAIALAKINIMNNSANAQKIDLKFDVETVTLFEQDDVVGFGAVDGASSVYVIAEDASDEVDTDGETITLEAFATLSGATSVIFSAQYYLFIVYKMGSP